MGYVRSDATSNAVVTDLISNSSAAKAGIRNGDRIVQAPNLSQAWRSETATVTGVFERGGKQFTATWLPRGAEVDAYHWERRAGIPDQSCKF